MSGSLASADPVPLAPPEVNRYVRSAALAPSVAGVRRPGGHRLAVAGAAGGCRWRRRAGRVHKSPCPARPASRCGRPRNAPRGRRRPGHGRRQALQLRLDSAPSPGGRARRRHLRGGGRPRRAPRRPDRRRRLFVAALTSGDSVQLSSPSRCSPRCGGGRGRLEQRDLAGGGRAWGRQGPGGDHRDDDRRRLAPYRLADIGTETVTYLTATRRARSAARKALTRSRTWPTTSPSTCCRPERISVADLAAPVPNPPPGVQPDRPVLPALSVAMLTAVVPAGRRPGRPGAAQRLRRLRRRAGAPALRGVRRLRGVPGGPDALSDRSGATTAGDAVLHGCRAVRGAAAGCAAGVQGEGPAPARPAAGGAARRGGRRGRPAGWRRAESGAPDPGAVDRGRRRANATATTWRDWPHTRCGGCARPAGGRSRRPAAAGASTRGLSVTGRSRPGGGG